MKMTIIILTYNEALHIGRCIDSVAGLAARVVVVDSFSTDNTTSIAKGKGGEVYQNAFINQAAQFRWAMENCNISSEWVMRLDADELISSDLSSAITDFVNNDGFGHHGGVFLRKHIFLGKWIRFGGRYPLPMLRLFRNGTAHIEQRWMDEHIVLDKGTSLVIKGGFEDNNLNSITWFIDKHNKYATREVVDIMLNRLNPQKNSQISVSTNKAIALKRYLKQKIYMNLPYFVRPFCYFLYRYFIQLGFLDGSRGFAYHFMQGFWYRALVDLKCMEIEQVWKGQVDIGAKLKVLSEYSGYSLSQLSDQCLN